MPNYPRIMLLSALAAGVCLGGAAAFPFGLGAAASQLMGFGTDPTKVQIALLATVVISGFIIGGAAWGGALAWIVGYPERGRIMWAGALGFGPATLAAALGLGALEPIAAQSFPELPLHTIFTLLFVPAVFIVNAVLGAALGVAIRAGKEGARLALAAGLAGALAFAVVDLAMDALGYRVGAPHAAERATMITVAMVSNLGAALNSGAMMGLLLARQLAQAAMKPGPIATEEMASLRSP
jgi:hypothetical protein